MGVPCTTRLPSLGCENVTTCSEGINVVIGDRREKRFLVQDSVPFFTSVANSRFAPGQRFGVPLTVDADINYFCSTNQINLALPELVCCPSILSGSLALSSSGYQQARFLQNTPKAGKLVLS